jgi:phospholipid N-methyltransferase
MNVSPANYKLAQDIWTEYALKPHSKHIATLSALACLAQLISERQPNRVVELGGGIGTITALLKRHPDSPPLLITLEDSLLCLPELRKLFEDDNKGHAIAQNPAQLSGMSADLLIIDGGSMSLFELETMRPGTTLFFEGNRVPERATVTEHVRLKGWNVIFTEDFLFMRDEPVPGKGCWIGTVR